MENDALSRISINLSRDESNVSCVLIVHHRTWHMSARNWLVVPYQKMHGKCDTQRVQLTRNMQNREHSDNADLSV